MYMYMDTHYYLYSWQLVHAHFVHKYTMLHTLCQFCGEKSRGPCFASIRKCKRAKNAGDGMSLNSYIYIYIYIGSGLRVSVAPPSRRPQDNVKYLTTLEKFIEPLYTGARRAPSLGHRSVVDVHLCMYVFIYVCMYACMHVCIKHVCIYVCMYICMYVCVVAFMYVCMHVCMCVLAVCMYACICVFMYLCM